MAQHELTDQEKQMLEKIAAIWIDFTKLPQTTQADLNDFRFHVDGLSRTIAYRPQFFNTLDEINRRAQNN